MTQMKPTRTKPLSKKSTVKAEIARKATRDSKKKDSGVVNYCVYGPSDKNDFPPSRLMEAVHVGLPMQELTKLQVTLAVPIEKLVPMLGISKATLHRRKAKGRLDSVESDRVVRYARLMGRAVDVMESEEYARQWLNSPQFGLGGAVPLEYAETEVGAREVENLLGRMEYGVYS